MSSTSQTRQNSSRNEQSQEQDETSIRMTERTQAEGSNHSTSANTESNEQPGDNYTTPSGSFTDGTPNHTVPELTISGTWLEHLFSQGEGHENETAF